VKSPFHIVDRNLLGRLAWDDFVARSDDAWLWHRFDLQDALALWPGRRDISFAILNNEGAVVAIMPLQVVAWKQKRVLRRSRLDSFGGLACHNNIIAKQKLHLMQIVMAYAETLAAKGCQGLHISLPPMAPGLRGEYCPRVNPLVLYGFENTLSQTWVIDLRLATELLWDQMEQRARRYARKAQKTLAVRRADRPGDLDVYYELHCQTYARSSLEPHPRAYFEAIWRDFLASGLATIWFAEHEGEVIAAENFGVFKQGAIYWTGASSHKGLTLGANPLLQWSAIQAFQTSGIEWYETGEAFPGALLGKSKGLNDFKRSFGGSLYPYYKGWMEMDAINAWVSHNSSRSPS
jgi:hypothetical protein